jgi:hypothetical protein
LKKTKACHVIFFFIEKSKIIFIDIVCALAATMMGSSALFSGAGRSRMAMSSSSSLGMSMGMGMQGAEHKDEDSD